MLLIEKNNYIYLIYPSGEVQYLYNIHKLKFKLSININYIINLCDFDNIILNCEQLISAKEDNIKHLVWLALSVVHNKYKNTYKAQSLKMTHYDVEKIIRSKAIQTDIKYHVINIFYNFM